MVGGAEVIVRIGKSFDAGAEKRITPPNSNGPLPDNAADKDRRRAAEPALAFLGNQGIEVAKGERGNEPLAKIIN